MKLKNLTVTAKNNSFQSNIIYKITVINTYIIITKLMIIYLKKY